MQHVERQGDVPFVLDRGDQIHHLQRIQLQVAGEADVLAKRHALFVEGFDQFDNAGEYLAAIGHRASLAVSCTHCQAIGAGCGQRSEEHTSELQSLMRNSYAVFCLKKKTSNLLEECT